MLKTLEIKDYALIDHIKVNFAKGLNIITGETGAGKSILIDAMSLLLGERASTEVVRKGAQKSFVEGIFDTAGNKKVKLILEENEIEFSDELIIRREISLKGSNRCFINDSPTQLQVVKELGDLLVDLHGQHEHQSLLNIETHIDFLDEFSGNQKLIEEYQSVYKNFQQKKDVLTRLIEKENSIKEKKDIYEFQLKEIDSVNPEPGEDDKILAELSVLENSEKIIELSEEIYAKLYDSENSVSDQLGEVRNKLSQLSQIDKSLSDQENDCESALAIVNEIASVIRSYSSKIDIDPKDVEEKRERLGALNLIKKKYGGTLQKVSEQRKKLNEEFTLAENFSAAINAAEKEIEILRNKLGEVAEKLSAKRKKMATKVEVDVKKFLSQLGIPDSSFEVRVSSLTSEKDDSRFVIINKKKLYADANGIDKVEFFISTNPGEDPKPLIRVASGGEVSRIMLSLKSILAKSDKLPLLIFDEIDTGISGRIAQKVGSALKQLASFHQVISITHLAQIAGQADHHFSVEKVLAEDRVVSRITKLKDDERINEVAKLLSGEKITDESLKGAKQLMQNPISQK